MSLPNIISQFNAKITSVHGHTKLGKPLYGIYYGIELEYEVPIPVGMDLNTAREIHRNKVAHTFYDSIRKFSFIKHDGSLKNGFEIVSVPMSLEEHQVKWKDLFKVIRKLEMKVRTSCGMHVHASREGLSPLQLGKMLVFLFSKKNTSFIKIIAGRTPPSKYSELKEKRVGDCKRHVERYSSLNLTSPQTIEFRLFKSTNNLSLVLKNIEFCAALIEFTWPARIGYTDLKKQGVNRFCKFIFDNKNVYPNLAQFLHTKGFIELKSNLTLRKTNPKRKLIKKEAIKKRGRKPKAKVEIKTWSNMEEVFKHEQRKKYYQQYMNIRNNISNVTNYI